MNCLAQETEGRYLTHAEAVRLTRQLSAELPGWDCEVMQDPCSDEWLVCLYHRERWEQFIRCDPVPDWKAKSGMYVAIQ